MDGINEIKVAAKTSAPTSINKTESGSSASVYNPQNKIVGKEGQFVQNEGSKAHEQLCKQFKNVFMIKGVLNKAGASNLEPMADKLIKKGSAIISDSVGVISALGEELKALQNNKDLTPEEIESKQKTIQAKIDAIQKEAGAKLNILDTLASSLPSMIGLAKEMQENGISLNVLFEVFDKITEGMSTKPTNFTGANSVDEVTKISQDSLKNILGPDSNDKLKSMDAGLDQKIKDTRKKIDDPQVSPEEKAKAKVELKIYNLQRQLVKNVASQLSSI